jgi:hypothetical protein
MTVVLLVIAGYPVARAVDPSVSRGASAGIGFIIGCGILTLAMMGVSAVGIGWTLPVLMTILAMVALGAVMLVRRQGHSTRTSYARTRVGTALDAVTVVSLSGYATYATIARPWDWDFWAIWGLKARLFVFAGGIDMTFLSNPDVARQHPDYPPLVPLLYSFSALVRGEWDDRWLGVFFVAFAVAAVLVLREELRRATGSDTFSALSTLALSGTACSSWIGLGDGVLAAFGTSALLVLARGVREDDRRAMTLAGILMGIVTLTKNEGLALAAAATVSLLAFSRRRFVSFAVPALFVSAPWLVWRQALKLETDVMSGGILARATERLSNPTEFFSAIGQGSVDRAGFWLILVVLLLVGGREVVRRHGMILTAILIQVACYFAIYAGTMHDLSWHIKTSMERISSHVSLAVGAICALAIWDLLLRGTTMGRSMSMGGRSDAGEGVETSGGDEMESPSHGDPSLTDHVSTRNENRRVVHRDAGRLPGPALG